MNNPLQKNLVTELLLTHKFCMSCASSLHCTQLDGEWRAACSNKQCDFVFWNNPTPVIAVLVEHLNDAGESQGFIMAHNVLWPEGMYSIITGFLEADDESAVLSAKRETKEELNLDAQRYHYIGNYTSSRANQIIIAYHIQATGDLALNHELDDYKRVPLEKLVGWETETGRAVGDFVTQLQNNLLRYNEF